jgi:hypothetical protein
MLKIVMTLNDGSWTAREPVLARPLGRLCSRSCGRQTRSQERLIDGVAAQLLPIQRNYGDPLEVRTMQRLVGADIHHLQLEIVLGLHVAQNLQRGVAQMAVCV